MCIRDSQRAETEYGGRKWIAWFTTEIPFQDGPYVFQGLPGLILEIKDENNNFLFTLTQIKKESQFFDSKSNKISINWKMMDALRKNFYEDPYKDLKPNSASNNFSKVKYTDENGNVIVPDFKEWTEHEQKKIRENNNPIELNHKIDSVSYTHLDVYKRQPLNFTIKKEQLKEILILSFPKTVKIVMQVMILMMKTLKWQPKSQWKKV